MIVTRRRLIEAGGGIFLAALLPRNASAAETIEVEMRGKDDGAHVWFDPLGIHIRPGQTIRWTNRDPGNSHTVTAYHPDVFDRPLRIPQHAKPWDSDYLLPGQSFSVTLTVPGVYDYYCVPHEHAGMVGRIVVGTPQPMTPSATDASLTPLPDVALNGFPPVDEIIAKGIVRHT
ncbi:plastocyanin/azurin family copper-binding protein [Aminobacter sp. HY435]|uniref:plastocyanin/azurin family copper-binding protein n=1 Tax=Aminobacter sp. HY435 TaxID=2970917 RepID=UPI0022B9D125|nr:plastocyanin/azurin family copper-binding protein [Aminobacter sp. HY435]